MSGSSIDLLGAGIPAIPAEILGVDVGAALTATGTTIADAYDIATEVAQFGTVAASTGAQLPDARIGGIFYVKNDGANALTLYPHSASGTINGGSAGAGVAVAAGEMCVAIRVSTLNWIATVAVAP
jgi:hypothetical protein